MKHLFTMFAIIALGIVTARAQDPYTVKYDEIQWQSGDEGTLLYWNPPTDGTDYSNLIVPHEFPNGKKLTKITSKDTGGRGGFRNKGLSKVVLEEGIEELLFWSFAYNQITDLTIPSTLTKIGEADFNSNQITTINGQPSDGLVYVYDADGNLDRSNIRSYGGSSAIVEIPAEVTVIGNHSFHSIKHVEKVTFEEGSQLETIANDAFYQCSNLVEMELPQGLKVLATGCLRYINIKELTIPSSVTSLGQYFLWGAMVETITFDKASQVNRFGTWLFRGASQLKEIEIPASVTGFGEQVFWGCTALKSVTFEEGSQLAQIGNNTFQNLKLESIVLPANLRTIPGNAFVGCSLDYLGFEDGSQLNAIQSNAFKDAQLKTVVIPQSVTSVGSGAFNNTGLQHIIFKRNQPGYFRNVIGNNQNSVETVNGAEYNAETGYVYLRRDENDIADHTVLTGSRENMEAINNIPAHVTTIANNAFNNRSVTSVTIPANVTTIEATAFIQNNIESLTFEPGSQLTFIGEGAFRWNWNNGVSAGMGDVEIPASVTNIEPGAFHNAGIKNLTFESGSKLTQINAIDQNNGAFSNNHLQSVTLPSSLARIDAYAFNSTNNRQAADLQILLTTNISGAQWENITNEGVPVTAIERTTDNDLQHAYVLTGAPTYDIVFYNEDGTTPIESFNDVNYGSIVMAPDAPNDTPTHHFIGWTKTNNPDDLDFVNVSNGVIATDDIDLYARYSDEFIVTFYNWDYSVLDQQLVKYQEAASNPVTRDENPIEEPVYKRDGYSFKGWDTDFSSVENNLTIKAVFGYTEYNITFESNGGSNVDPIPFSLEKSIGILPNPTKAGFSFTGWFKNEDLTDRVTSVTAANFQEDITLYARWSINVYTVTLHNNGGTGEDAIYYSGDDHEEIDIPVPVWENESYTFAGWYQTEDFTGDVITVISRDTYEDMELYAKWDATEFTITLHNNDGTDETELTYTIESADFDLPQLSRDGYDFIDWYDTYDFSNGTITTITTGNYGNMEFFAKWEITEYTLTFVTDGTAADPMTYTIEDTPLTLPASDKEHYTFMGWTDGTATPMRELPSGYYGSKTLTAQWTANEYSITFHSEEGDAVNAATYTIEDGPITLPVPASTESHTFEGWYQDEEHTTGPLTEWDAAEGIHVNLYALWTIKTFTVTFLNDDNSEIVELTVDHGGSIDNLPTPTSQTGGSAFIGWFDGDVQVTDFTTITDNLTVMAKFDTATNLNPQDALKIKVYPNPATTHFTIEGAGGETLSIFSVSGAMVKQVNNLSNNQTIQTGNLPKGIYIVKAGNYSQRLIIK
ncbi:MAG: leucine-rich repeat protein [Bacteroidales bacterium]|nr:leucine-rich repeat protein [Bacteroidales bacterium]